MPSLCPTRTPTTRDDRLVGVTRRRFSQLRKVTTMFEFRIVDEADQDKQPGYVVRRLRQLLAMATKLQKAGWLTRFTLTGLAFEPPAGSWARNGTCSTPGRQPR
jgi:hypothetical protein